ncbi:MAG: hypothetical protein JXA03_04270 [Bacteroidales bacterium]|nr:hypothetical protein [Bacteroidales bacterium]
MKKSAILFVSLLVGMALQAQNANRTSAFNYHRNGKLDKAKEYIDKATQHEQTINDARTWYYAGNIYLDIYRSQDEKFRNLDKDALNKAYNAYDKSISLDEKNEYYAEIVPRILLCAEEFFNSGANRFNKGLEFKNSGNASDLPLAKLEFDAAVPKFEKAIAIYSKVGNVDTVAHYYTAFALEQAGDSARAKVYFEKLVYELNYKQAAVYHSLFNIYYKYENDTVKALNIVLEGRKIYPGDLALMYDETNIYLGRNEEDKALQNLNVAMELDKTNPTIYFAAGSIIDKQIVSDTTKTDDVRETAFKQAEDAYLKAIELNPEYFDAIYNLGALYYNKSLTYINAATRLPLEAVEEYNRMTNEYRNLMQKALPYLEKAHAIDPTDMSTMIALKEIYVRLNMNEKRKEIEEKLKK